MQFAGSTAVTLRNNGAGVEKSLRGSSKFDCVNRQNVFRHPQKKNQKTFSTKSKL